MDKLDNALLKIACVDTCFLALENFIDKVEEEKTQESINRLQYLFYLLWDQTTEARKELEEAANEIQKNKSYIIQKLESENKELKEKLSTFPFV